MEVNSRKEPWSFLDTWQDFKEYLRNTFTRAKKHCDCFRKFKKILSRTSLLTIYKSFIRILLDYEQVIHDQTCSAYFPFIFQNLYYC